MTSKRRKDKGDESFRVPSVPDRKTALHNLHVLYPQWSRAYREFDLPDDAFMDGPIRGDSTFEELIEKTGGEFVIVTGSFSYKRYGSDTFIKRILERLAQPGFKLTVFQGDQIWGREDNGDLSHPFFDEVLLKHRKKVEYFHSQDRLPLHIAASDQGFLYQKPHFEWDSGQRFTYGGGDNVVDRVRKTLIPKAKRLESSKAFHKLLSGERYFKVERLIRDVDPTGELPEFTPRAAWQPG